jgi:hypothetical protein
MADLIEQAFGTPPTNAPSAGTQDMITAAFGTPPDTSTASAPAPAQASPSAPLSAGERFMTGLGDAGYGLGQLVEHTPGLHTVVEGLQDLGQVASEGAEKGFNALGMKGAANVASDLAVGFEPQTASQFDQIVQQRNAEYENARNKAGQTGIDWWRLGGEAANPINYLSAGEGAAATVGGRILQAGATGTLASLSQPVNTHQTNLSDLITGNTADNSAVPGGYWWDKTKQALAGFTTGGVGGTIVETLAPALRVGTNMIRSRLGAGAPDGAAEQVVNEAMSQKGLDPNTVPVPLLKAMKNEVHDALQQGAEPNPFAIVNRLKAESLPVPVQLMRGQATGDPMAFSRELNLRGIQGVGEPITTRLQQQNAAFIGNLDALGAKDAPSTVSTGQYLADKLNSKWNQMESNKNMLYSAVKNSAGQPAKVDQFSAAQGIKDALDTPEASHSYDLLPANIQKTIDDMLDGKMELDVGKLQLLDKTWGQAAAGASDGSVSHAITSARQILNNAPIQDDVGQQAMQAYNAAKAAHAEQMGLISPKLLNGRPNPNFQPLMKDVVDGKPPEKLYGSAFLNSAPSQGAKNLKFMQGVDPNAPEIVGRTLMGEIKRQALSSASDERGTISQSVLNGWARDPVQSARMQALMPSPAVQTFKNLADTVETAKRFPVGSAVNTSNTGSTLVNAGMSMLKNSAVAQIARRIPLIHAASEGIKEAGIKSEVQGALKPGVTLSSMLRGTPAQAARQKLLSNLLVPGFTLKETKEKKNGTND